MNVSLIKRMLSGVKEILKEGVGDFRASKKVQSD